MSGSTEGGDEPFRNASPLHDARYDPDSNQGLIPSILEAVAVLEERPVAALREDPLHESIDAEAVEILLFGSRQDGGTSTAGQRVTFVYRGYLIRIHSDGRILLFDADDTSA